MNRDALIRSLQSLTELGTPGLADERIREYVVLYNDTLKYINKYKNEDSILKELYGKFPKVELKEFNKPLDKMIDLIFRFLASVFSGRIIGRWGMDPRRRKYINSVHESMRLINTLSSELIMRIGE